MVNCVVASCRNEGSFRVPRGDPLTKKLWVTAVRCEHLNHKTRNNIMVCSAHFTQDDFTNYDSEGVRLPEKILRPGSIPTIFPWSKDNNHNAPSYNKSNDGERFSLFEEMNAGRDIPQNERASKRMRGLDDLPQGRGGDGRGGGGGGGSMMFGGENTVLLVLVDRMTYPVPLNTLYKAFSQFGSVLKIATFTKNNTFQAHIQFLGAEAAQNAKMNLSGRNIYNGCCTMHIEDSRLTNLNVKYNNEESRDYTNPNLPRGPSNNDEQGLFPIPEGVLPIIQGGGMPGAGMVGGMSNRGHRGEMSGAGMLGGISNRGPRGDMPGPGMVGGMPNMGHTVEMPGAGMLRGMPNMGSQTVEMPGSGMFRGMPNMGPRGLLNLPDDMNPSPLGGGLMSQPHSRRNTNMSAQMSHGDIMSRFSDQPPGLLNFPNDMNHSPHGGGLMSQPHSRHNTNMSSPMSRGDIMSRFSDQPPGLMNHHDGMSPPAFDGGFMSQPPLGRNNNMSSPMNRGDIMSRFSDQPPVDEMSYGGRRDRPGDEEESSGQPGVRPGDWECSSCQFKNFAFRDTCMKCKDSKDSMNLPDDRYPSPLGGRLMNQSPSGRSTNMSAPMARADIKSRLSNQPPDGVMSSGGPGERLGDWKCSSCKFENFAFRNTCRKCDRSKDQIGDRIGSIGLQIQDRLGGQGHCVLVVKGLNQDKVTCDAVFTLFGVYGNVMRVKILKDKKALVQMAEQKQVELAITNLDKVTIWGKTICVIQSQHPSIIMPKDDDSDEHQYTKDYSDSLLHRFNKSGSKNYQNIFPPSPVLHLSNLPEDLDPCELEEAFTDAGATVVDFMFLESSNKGLIKLSSTDDAIEALINMNNYQLDEESYLRISFSKKNF